MGHYILLVILGGPSKHGVTTRIGDWMSDDQGPQTCSDLLLWEGSAVGHFPGSAPVDKWTYAVFSRAPIIWSFVFHRFFNIGWMHKFVARVNHRSGIWLLSCYQISKKMIGPPHKSGTKGFLSVNTHMVVWLPWPRNWKLKLQIICTVPYSDTYAFMGIKSKL